MRPLMWSSVLLIVLLSTGMQVYARGVYQEPEAFLQDIFSDAVPEPAMVWVTRAIRPTVEKILGHKPNALRIRYWRKDARTAWILEEIGKEKPITTGIVISNGRIERVKVLVFRESRGWEVRHSFFTDQFKDAAIKPDCQLDKYIDGVSGATLSVRALRKLARMALFLDQHVRNAQ
jgi:hypothetical protein